MGDRTTGQGLATVVFVDLERSTELLDRVGDEVGTASVQAQLDLVRERLADYDGVEVKSLGDGLMLMFASPRQAVAFALASQRALGPSTPRARFGINTGEVVDAGSDPVGGAVNAAARIADRASGGEVVVSDVVRQLVGSTATIAFRDRGRCRLKGFSERWHLWVAEDSSGGPRASATIGRTQELAVIEDLVASTTSGRGLVLVLEGEAGIGKTHLAAVAVQGARQVGLTTVEVGADEVVRRPGAIAHGLLEATSPGPAARGRLERLLTATPGQGQPGTEDLSYSIIEATVELIEDMARIRPVLLAAEDLHWADDLSLGVLSAIARRVGVSRFGIVASLRPTPRPPALDRLLEVVHEGPGQHLRLDSLDDVDVHALASALTGAAPGRRLRERIRSTAGNPLFVIELLRSLDDDGLLTVDAGVADVAGDSVPANLHETLVRRLSWLPVQTNELLRLASLLGARFTLHDLSVITGQTVIDVAAGLRDASLAGLVVGDGDQLSFRHDLIRDAVYGHMLGAERRDLHRAAGQALARAGAPTQLVARQLARGALPGDLEAVDWLARAASETISVSPTSAVETFQEALALAPSPWPGRAALQAQMVEPLSWCGRFDEAEALVDVILRSNPDPAAEFAALRGLSSVEGNRGSADKAIALLHRAADAPGAPTAEARRLRCMAAQLSLMTGTMGAAAVREVANRTLGTGIAEDDVSSQCLAHQVLGFLHAVTGYAVESSEHFRTSAALFDTGRVTDASYLIPDAALSVALLQLGEISDAMAAAAAARRRAEERGTVTLLPMTSMASASADLSVGRWDDAVAKTEAGLAVIADTGDLNFVLYHEAALARIATHRGDLASAREHIDAGTAHLAGGAPLFGADWLLHAEAELLTAEAEPEAALALAEVTWVQTRPIRYLFGYRERGTFLVRAALAAGRRDLAEAVAVELEEGARRTPVDTTIATALQCRALVDGDPEVALDAVARFRQTPMQPELARAAEDAAGVLVATDRRHEAVELLREASELQGELGADGDATRVDAALRALGSRRNVTRPRRPDFGWEALTPMEVKVSDLVAEGLTNPEIGARLYISRRTVETHLSHVFRKVDVASRTQLAAEVVRRGHAE